MPNSIEIKRKTKHRSREEKGRVQLGLAALIGLGIFSWFYGERVVQDQNELQAVNDTMEAYRIRYGCAFPTIDFSFGRIDVQGVYTNSGNNQLAMETAEPGRITIDRERLAMFINSHDDMDVERSEMIEFITAHAMSHACIPQDPTPVAQPYIIDPVGHRVVAYHGLSINVMLTNGETVPFHLLEEAAAEVIARDMFPSSPAEDISGFRHIADLLTLLMDRTGTKPGDLPQYLRNNDVEGFTGEVLGKEDVTGEDVALLSRVMMQVLEEVGSPQAAFEYLLSDN